jgi:hypothetical protein
MILLIRDALVYPPTWLASFRDLTLFVAVTFKCDILIESDNPDDIYPRLKRRGALDFVRDFVRPGTERGVHLDTETRFPPTVSVGKIVPENTIKILECLSDYIPPVRRELGANAYLAMNGIPLLTTGQ